MKVAVDTGFYRSRARRSRNCARRPRCSHAVQKLLCAFPVLVALPGLQLSDRPKSFCRSVLRSFRPIGRVAGVGDSRRECGLGCLARQCSHASRLERRPMRGEDGIAIGEQVGPGILGGGRCARRRAPRTRWSKIQSPGVALVADEFEARSLAWTGCRPAQHEPRHPECDGAWIALGG